MSAGVLKAVGVLLLLLLKVMNGEELKYQWKQLKCLGIEVAEISVEVEKLLNISWYITTDSSSYFFFQKCTLEKAKEHQTVIKSTGLFVPEFLIWILHIFPKSLKGICSETGSCFLVNIKVWATYFEQKLLINVWVKCLGNPIEHKANNDFPFRHESNKVRVKNLANIRDDDVNYTLELGSCTEEFCLHTAPFCLFPSVLTYLPDNDWGHTLSCTATPLHLKTLWPNALQEKAGNIHHRAFAEYTVKITSNVPINHT